MTTEEIWKELAQSYEQLFERKKAEVLELEEQCQSWADQSRSWKLKADVLSRERVEAAELREIIDELKGRLRLAESERDTWQRLAVSSEMLRKKAEEQRDRLAEALQDIRNRALDETIGLHPDAEAKGCVDDCLEWAESALAALKGGADE